MSDITFHLDTTAAEALLARVGKEFAFGASVALNRTLDEAQLAIRQGLPAHFTLRRRQFVERTIYRQRGLDFATKHSLVAGVRIHPERDFLAKFEAGGVKRPRGQALAIPLRGARAQFAAIVPKRFRLGVLRGSTRAQKTFVRGGILWLRKNKRTVVPLYRFVAQVPIPASLDFVETGSRVILTRWGPNLEGVLRKLIDGTFVTGRGAG